MINIAASNSIPKPPAEIGLLKYLGKYEINMNLMEYFNIPTEKGVPRVLVFDKNNNLLNSSSTKEWTTARDRKQQDIFNYFQNLITE